MTQACGLFSTSSVGCVLGSLLQPLHLPTWGLPTEAPISVPEAGWVTPIPPPHCSPHSVIASQATVFTENSQGPGKPQTWLPINPVKSSRQA